MPQKASPRSSGKRVAFGLFCVALIVATAGLFGWSFREPPPRGEQTELVHFHVGVQGRLAVVDELAAIGLVDSPLLMKLYVGLLAPGAQFAPRDHLLQSGLSPREIVQRLAGVGDRPSARVTFPEGWSHFQMAERLEAAQICSRLGFEAAVSDAPLLESLGINGTSAEGWLFPATYDFRVDSDPRHIVARLVKESRERLSKLRAGALHPDLTAAGLDDQGLIILASIIEKETGARSERPQVARVFLNRLLNPSLGTRGRLQSDPTAAYGCQSDPVSAPSCAGFAGRITPAMLSDRENAYNTYRHSGLPPGPISNPGEKSIGAVLSPAEGNWLYFVADGKGGHTFSESFADHQAAVSRLKELRSR